MRIIRAAGSNITGDFTVTSGDVIVTDNTKGIILENQDSESLRITVRKEEGVNTLQIKDA